MSETAKDARIPGPHAENLLDPAAYADGRLHETWRWLRPNNPLGIAEVNGFDPFWAVRNMRTSLR